MMMMMMMINVYRLTESDFVTLQLCVRWRWELLD